MALVAVAALLAGFAPSARSASFGDPFASYADTVRADAPVAYWRLGERDGLVAADASGNGHDAAYAVDASDGSRQGALANDSDWAAGDPLSGPAAGLPTGDRTVEAWVQTGSPGTRVFSYGDFTIAVEDRALVVAGRRFALGAQDDRLITDSHWHQVVVTYGAGMLTAYLDGVALGAPQAASLTTGGGFAAGGDFGLDELAVYPRALDAATVAAHFAASGNARPAAVSALAATAPEPNRVRIEWDPPQGGHPLSQPLLDDYIVEAWQGDALVAAQTVDANPIIVSFARRAGFGIELGSVPAGTTRVTVRSAGGFGVSAAASVTVEVGGAPGTYSTRVAADAPALYWRFSDTGARVSDLSGHALIARYGGRGSAAGALAGDDDWALGTGRGFNSDTDLVWAPVATGMPTGDRTLEAWVATDTPGTRVLQYGDFSVAVRGARDRRVGRADRAAGGRPPAAHRQPLARRRDRLRKRRGHGLRGRRAVRHGGADPRHERRRRAARRPRSRGRAGAAGRARALPAGARRGDDRRALRRVRRRAPERADGAQRDRRHRQLDGAGAAARPTASRSSTTTCWRPARAACCAPPAPGRRRAWR